jgi:hypothetical protein
MRFLGGKRRKYFAAAGSVIGCGTSPQRLWFWSLRQRKGNRDDAIVAGEEVGVFCSILPEVQSDRELEIAPQLAGFRSLFRFCSNADVCQVGERATSRVEGALTHLQSFRLLASSESAGATVGKPKNLIGSASNVFSVLPLLRADTPFPRSYAQYIQAVFRRG